ncbi:Scr1 family TA system antitoxin-like transcriptional regulator [Streptomyces corynorhini]|uniref:DUF5753 domain-containing protein n=1 Tax=Streptomyces corynorhini TaxID=2282652 RepID=A0A370AZR9_9ACTN|nr:Scr1 family TA system antitoxin-like transcriptional regulator [Streptomyces corynorhini]RDG32595.1 hypothetical protein DVH02_32330 [Streptomyces corynorhini]
MTPSAGHGSGAGGTGASPGLEGPFSILTLPEPVPGIVRTEGIAAAFPLEGRAQVRECTRRFGVLAELALPRAESGSLIAKMMKTCE